METRALGKGLSALIPDNIKIEKSESVAYLKTSQIKDSTHQPRKDYDTEKLSDLIASIKEKGVLQPILVRKKGEGYEVIAGERRLKAARALSLNEVPVFIKDVSDQEALVLALIENIQREELNVIEEAEAYKRLIDEFNLTQDIVAQSVGKNRATVTNTLRLLKLPDEIQESLLNNTLTMGHARSLLSVENPQKQKRIFEQILKRGLSVRELENLVRKEITGTAKSKKSRTKDPYIVAMQEELQMILGTKVRIEPKNNSKGKIVIEYYSSTDLDRITGTIKK